MSPPKRRREQSEIPHKKECMSIIYQHSRKPKPTILYRTKVPVPLSGNHGSSIRLFGQLLTPNPPVQGAKVCVAEQAVVRRKLEVLAKRPLGWMTDVVLPGGLQVMFVFREKEWPAEDAFKKCKMWE